MAIDLAHRRCSQFDRVMVWGVLGRVKHQLALGIPWLVGCLFDKLSIGFTHLIRGCRWVGAARFKGRHFDAAKLGQGCELVTRFRVVDREAADFSKAIERMLVNGACSSLVDVEFFLGRRKPPGRFPVEEQPTFRLGAK